MKEFHARSKRWRAAAGSVYHATSIYKKNYRLIKLTNEQASKPHRWNVCLRRKTTIHVVTYYTKLFGFNFAIHFTPVMCHTSSSSSTRYLGIYMVSAKVFKCSLHYAKCAFHRAANAIFGKVGRTFSEEVLLQLVKSKCLPILLYSQKLAHLQKLT